jgi:hypothetical protein
LGFQFVRLFWHGDYLHCCGSAHLNQLHTKQKAPLSRQPREINTFHPVSCRPIAKPTRRLSVASDLNAEEEFDDKDDGDGAG